MKESYWIGECNIGTAAEPKLREVLKRIARDVTLAANGELERCETCGYTKKSGNKPVDEITCKNCGGKDFFDCSLEEYIIEPLTSNSQITIVLNGNGQFMYGQAIVRQDDRITIEVSNNSVTGTYRTEAKREIEALPGTAAAAFDEMMKRHIRAKINENIRKGWKIV